MAIARALLEDLSNNWWVILLRGIVGVIFGQWASNGFGRLAHTHSTALGFTLFSKSPAHGCTAIEPPAGVDASGVVKRLREVHGITVAGGQDHMKGKMIRVGHMGSYDLSDIYVVLGALEECVNAAGHKAGGAIEAARRGWESA